MDPYFGLKNNIMPQMIGNIYQMPKLSKGYPGTPILNEAMIRTYKTEFIKAMNQEIY